MTECSKPLDFVKNSIFLGAAAAVIAAATSRMVKREAKEQNFDAFICFGIGRIIAKWGYETILFTKLGCRATGFKAKPFIQPRMDTI